MKTYTKYFMLAAALSAPAWLHAQNAKFDSLKAVISQHPEDVAAHTEFIRRPPEDSALISQQYAQWMKQFPNVAAVYYGYGAFFAHRESPAAQPYLEKAIALDPKLGPAYVELSLDVERRGDFNKASEYLGKAVAADPGNVDYLSSYAYSFQKTNPAKYIALSEELLKKFPESQRAAQSLYWRAYRAKNDKEQLAIYERLRKDYPVAKFAWSGYAMSDYVDILLDTNPDEALKLATALNKESSEDFGEKLAYVNQIRTINALIKANKGDEAEAVLSKMKIRRYGRPYELYTLLKAKAVAGRSPLQSYDTLLKYYASTPSRRVKESLYAYGKQNGKDAAKVEKELRDYLVAAAKPAAFNFEAYLTPGKVTMQDYKGKVVLLTFWFPGCGPCRGEFPHFENVLQHFRQSPVSYVGVNIVSEQDDYVIPFVKGSGYSFRPLKDEESARTNLPVRGAPSNFLIDQEGRIIFSGFMIGNREEEEMLQDMIELLLNKRA
ncbi:TlpA disulfide reductase family protein [Chitinophaga vietnamensis]|uniref:TlpA disulfide reductase family protein n=1 Tax=Chitinophaga vietnamensis TaxID=2593957 RepID=UPI0011787B09|nr:TlpA disulfide reductase family protein [Chitinophaga vietnamensis]